ncbi:TPA: hypothetical protein QEG37_002021 [Pluralibacter gergoviae]|nr:hypothetical protein [Pluralibacter gergoviae]HDS1241443.1 hypothetical protein [Pluralibacter gergoviae]HDS1248958.1 hypothetical protein [Pluralibacter gergoviae]HDS1254150.1 hypothetical protein [Pluralibacter gergoviae]HDS1257629.1 hypothetical protein [Pluralibacter gergoviae]
MSRLAIVGMVLASVAALCALSWYSGWNSHADHINALAAAKQKKAEAEIRPVEEKAAASTTQAQVVYKTITRDVVKYVQSPNRTVCKFDDDAVQLRQRAIDAANTIPGFDEPAVQGK